VAINARTVNARAKRTVRSNASTFLMSA
jgi:hypothetical protein